MNPTLPPISEETQAANGRHTAQGMDAIIGLMREPTADPETAPLEVEPPTPAERKSVRDLEFAIYMLDVELHSMLGASANASKPTLEKWLAEAAGRASTLQQIAKSLLEGGRISTAPRFTAAELRADPLTEAVLARADGGSR